MSILQATCPAVKPETAREWNAWLTDMRTRRDMITADGRRTEVIARIFALMFGRELNPHAYGAGGEEAAAERLFTSVEKCPPWLRSDFTALMVEATTPAPPEPEPVKAGAPVHGTALGVELRTMLRSFTYCPKAISDTVAFIAVHGTATGSPADAEDVGPLNDLIMRMTAHLEFEDGEWPAVWSEGYWTASDPEPARPAEAPATAGDRAWWAATSEAEARVDSALDRMADEASALESLTLGLVPADRKPIKVRPNRRRWAASDTTDADMALHGSVG